MTKTSELQLIHKMVQSTQGLGHLWPKNWIRGPLEKFGTNLGDGIWFDNELQINKQKQKVCSSSDLFICNNVHWCCISNKYIHTYIYKHLHLCKKQFNPPDQPDEVIHVFTMYIWQHVFGTFIGLQVASPSRSSSESSSLAFNQEHSWDILQSYLKVSHKDFTNLISLSFCKASITSHNWMYWYGGTGAGNAQLCFYVHLWVIQNTRKVREKSESFSVNFAETKSNFAYVPLMSLLGLCTWT